MKLIKCNKLNLADGEWILFDTGSSYEAAVWEDYIHPEGGVVFSNGEECCAEDLPNIVYRIVK